MKHRKGMSLSQRKQYNKYCRLYNIRKALREGRIPQPRKDVDNRIMQVYRDGGVEHAVIFPQSWMDDAIREGIKQDMKAIRAAIRDLLPAEISKKRVKLIGDMLLSGKITVAQIRAVK